jgi:hypothetical protein
MELLYRSLSWFAFYSSPIPDHDAYRTFQSPLGPRPRGLVLVPRRVSVELRHHARNQVASHPPLQTATVFACENPQLLGIHSSYTRHTHVILTAILTLMETLSPMFQCPPIELSFTVRWARLGCIVLTNTTSPQCLRNPIQ